MFVLGSSENIFLCFKTEDLLLSENRFGIGLKNLSFFLSLNLTSVDRFLRFFFTMTGLTL